MRLAGRLTIYGEHLMSGEAFGLIAPSVLFLADEDDGAAFPHPTYDPTRDSVRAMLLQQGARTSRQIRGDLPFGYGFASSTALALLHLRTPVLAESLPFIDSMDGVIHGFTPSGVDSQFYVRQRGGLYRLGEWVDVHDATLRWSGALLPKEGRFTLPEARAAIRRHRESLAARAEGLTADLMKNGCVSHMLLREYALDLLQTGGYSGEARRLVQHALECGIVAKAIGGIYDKAILFLRCDRCCGATRTAMAELETTVRAIVGSRWLPDV